MYYSRIVATGSYLPEKVLMNQDLEKMVDTSDEWIFERTGIRSRHIAAEGETASMLAEKAVRNALQDSTVALSDIDMIIVATTTGDLVMPCTAAILQDRLQLPGIPVFDVATACAGFIYGLSIADQFIRTGNMKTILIVGTEVMSSILDWTDRRTCVLFGDGAGVAILQRSEEPGILSTHIHADGSYNDILYVPSSLPGQFDADQLPYVQMEGNKVFKFAVKALGDVVHEALAANNAEKSEIDWLIPHQANMRIITATAKKLGLPMEQVVVTVDSHGNTSAASVPLALDLAIRDGRIQRGQKLLLEGFGGGLAWGSAFITY